MRAVSPRRRRRRQNDGTGMIWTGDMALIMMPTRRGRESHILYIYNGRGRRNARRYFIDRKWLCLENRRRLRHAAVGGLAIKPRRFDVAAIKCWRFIIFRGRAIAFSFSSRGIGLHHNDDFSLCRATHCSSARLLFSFRESAGGRQG